MAADRSYFSFVGSTEQIWQRAPSPVEALDATAAPVEERKPSMKALVDLERDQTRKRARGATDAVVSDRSLGFLHGEPCGLKDLFDCKPGWRTALGGTPALTDVRRDCSSISLERVEAQGGIFIGRKDKTGPEFRGTQARSWLASARDEARTGLAEGGVPIGAVLVGPDGDVWGRGHSRRVQDGDPSGHVETAAFRAAGRQASHRGATMVTTLARAATAAAWSGSSASPPSWSGRPRTFWAGTAGWPSTASRC